MQYRQGLEPFAKIVAGDRRLTMRLMGIWQGLRYGTTTCAPAAEFFASVPSDLWTDCCVVTRGEGKDWELTRIGETIARRSGVRAERTPIGDLPPDSLLAIAVRELDDAIKSGAPILGEGTGQDEEGHPALYRSILLPLAGEDGEIDLLVAGARCRMQSQNA
ncbi:MAG: hypothetical protein OEO83_15875 [Alphaproteobacteria bacterium]|nr:hypothetical protein [Alphaproteobacteria bacterium]